MSERGGITKRWQFINDTAERKTILGKNNTFLQQLSVYTQIRTLILPWDNTPVDSSTRKLKCRWRASVHCSDAQNIFPQDYYHWSATASLCSEIETSASPNRFYYSVSHKYGCNRNISADLIEKPIPLHRSVLNKNNLNTINYYWKVTEHRESKTGLKIERSTEDDYYNKSPPIATYCHVISDAIVSGVGHVYTYNMTFVPDNTCFLDGNHSELTTKAASSPLYDELLVITQRWGTVTFHRMVEIVPRVVVFADFIKRHPNIRILAPERDGGRLSELLHAIGLNGTGRLVTGWARAKVVYLPRPSLCGTVSVLETQLLSRLYNRHIVDRLLGEFNVINSTQLIKHQV